METVKAERVAVEQFLDSGFLDLDGVLNALEAEVRPASKLFGKAGLEVGQCPPGKRKLAIAISGGGAAGAYNAGLLEVLLDGLKRRAIDVDLLVGTSSGAVNGYGVFVEALGMGNRQFQVDPAIRQPFDSYIASVWSYLDRDGKASRWVVGQRSWIVWLASRGFPSRLHKAGLAVLLLAAAALLQPSLLLPLFLMADAAGIIPQVLVGWDGLAQSTGFRVGWALGATVLLGAGAWLFSSAFRKSLFSDLPLLRLLANTGPDGDLKRHSRMSRGQAVDRCRNLSRDLVARWYQQRDQFPEFIITGTDLSAGRECLFTLVRRETLRRLRRREWMVVQFDSERAGTADGCALERSHFCLPENLVRAVVASSAVPGAFPSQCVGIYRAGSGQVARHHFVDGGVLNHSPVHVAIDAGATHVISLEVLPFRNKDLLADEGRSPGSYKLLEAALATFTTVLERATQEDVRRTASWNRFLVAHPTVLGPGPAGLQTAVPTRRIVQIYRIAPSTRLVGTVEFDGQLKGSGRRVTLRDLLRQGVRDMRGRCFWNATVRHHPDLSDTP